MILTRAGLAIRMGVNTVTQLGRSTQGVRLIRLRTYDEIASVIKMAESEEEAVLNSDDITSDDANSAENNSPTE